ncbi:pentraxin-4 [Protopterus annectens]|uniref:pentraxin-4 n=1 Tax=Protopterus annectens TaxID=7888 RepID=UPI001CF93952|nr:pentraxin-4 [Protopterus annectens]
MCAVKLMYLMLILTCLNVPHNFFQNTAAATVGQRKPFFERLRRLEEQFRRFQEMTLTRLQGIAENYNISYNIDERFQNLQDQYQNVTSEMLGIQTAINTELDSHKTWMKKLQKKINKLDVKVASLEEIVNERTKQSMKDNKEQSVLLSNLTAEIREQRKETESLVSSKNSLQKDLQRIQDGMKTQGLKLSSFEEQLKRTLQRDPFPPESFVAPQILNQTPQDKQEQLQDRYSEHRQQKLKKLQVKHQQSKQLQERQQIDVQFYSQPPQYQTLSSNPPVPEKLQREPRPHSNPKDHETPDKQEEPKDKKVILPVPAEIPKLQSLQTSATICNVHSVLFFPDSSTRNFVTFHKGFKTGLHELSICTWLRTSTSYVGTILSYATPENDNKLVLHGRNTTDQSVVHFVIGDPVFRQLPVEMLLDNRWHHICVIWSAIQGKYWYYVDRKLMSTGSRFQKDYEVPAGGSLIVGQEQDMMGGGFETAEAFVGNLAGFAVWNRALNPGEVSGIATGKGLPRGTVVTLEDIATVNGAVEHINCTCLEHCV